MCAPMNPLKQKLTGDCISGGLNVTHDCAFWSKIWSIWRNNDKMQCGKNSATNPNTKNLNKILDAFRFIHEKRDVHKLFLECIKT